MIKIGKTKIILDEMYGDDPKEVLITDIPKYIGETVEIEDGVTFKRIFDICIMNRHLFNTIFYSFTRGYDIDYYIDDFLSKTDDSDHETNIDYLEVYRVYEHMIFDDKSEDHSYYYGIHGVGKADEHGITNYGIGFSSLYSLKNLVIKTNNELNITVDTGLSFNDENFNLKDKYKTVHVAQIPITLFNFIGAILHEISFHGTPANRDEFLSGLNETSRQIDAGEMELFEMKKDENGKYYFESKDGKISYLDKDLNNEKNN